MTTDVELVERSRRRDATAFGTLVTRHQQLVFGVALARCHDPALAEDVAQEAFVAAWRDLDRLREADRVGTWVAGIARNLAANAVRTRARRERAQLEPAPDAPSPEDVALEREDRELLQRALADLRAVHRETLVLYYLESQSIAQIAASLAISEDVVKQRLSRGRRALRDGVATRVETVLARTRLRPAFCAGVLAALAAANPKPAAAGNLMMLMTAKNVAFMVATVVVAGGAVWIDSRSPESATAAPISTASKLAAAPVLAATAKPHAERFPDKAARERLVAAIHDAQVHRTAAVSPSSAPSSSAGGSPPTLPGGDLDRDFIRAAVREIIPMLTECYENGLLRDLTLEGNVVVDFTIEGEPDVGGVVSESSIDADSSTLGDATVRECIEQTMYAIKIDPPADGGTVKVRYPFTFRPAPVDQAPPFSGSAGWSRPVEPPTP